MTTAVSETVKEVEVLRHQAQATRRVVHINVDGITQEESLIQPTPGGSCLNWVVGHLVATYNQMLPLLGQKPVLEESDHELFDLLATHAATALYCTSLQQLAGAEGLRA